MSKSKEKIKFPSTISAGQLHASQRFHIRSIKHMFYMRSSVNLITRSPHLGDGFPLRCFQRLSDPNVANQPRLWQDDWHTRGSSAPVLSY